MLDLHIRSPVFPYKVDEFEMREMVELGKQKGDRQIEISIKGHHRCLETLHFKMAFIRIE